MVKDVANSHFVKTAAMFLVMHYILIGFGIIMLTFMLHAFAIDRLMHAALRLMPRTQGTRYIHSFWKMAVLFITGNGVILLHSVEIWVWAFLYLYLAPPTLPDFETALYFSAASFSTLGYGDVVMPPGGRILGAMEATSGLILVGWSTAFMFEVLATMYSRLGSRQHSRTEGKS